MYIHNKQNVKTEQKNLKCITDNSVLIKAYCWDSNRRSC